MGRKSKLARLPEDVRESVHRRLADGRSTEQEIADGLNEQGHEVSRSAVHRYARNFRKLGERMRFAREGASALGKSLEDMPNAPDVGRLLIEGIEVELLDLFLRMSDTEVSDDERRAGLEQIGKTVRDLKAAQKSSIDAEVRLADRILKKAAAAGAEVAKQNGLSDETVAEVRARILGVRGTK